MHDLSDKTKATFKPRMKTAAEGYDLIKQVATEYCQQCGADINDRTEVRRALTWMSSYAITEHVLGWPSIDTLLSIVLPEEDYQTVILRKAPPRPRPEPGDDVTDDPLDIVIWENLGVILRKVQRVTSAQKRAGHRGWRQEDNAQVTYLKEWAIEYLSSLD